MIVLKKILRLIPAFLITGISFYFSSQPTNVRMPDFWNSDKLVHLICYGGLSFWVSFGLSISRLKKIFIPLTIVSLYGIFDEIHQSFVPGRSCSVFDWMADTIGAFLGGIAYLLLIKLINKIKNNEEKKY